MGYEYTSFVAMSGLITHHVSLITILSLSYEFLFDKTTYNGAWGRLADFIHY